MQINSYSTDSTCDGVEDGSWSVAGEVVTTFDAESCGSVMMVVDYLILFVGFLNLWLGNVKAKR